MRINSGGETAILVAPSAESEGETAILVAPSAESEGETSILVAPSAESEGETSILVAPSAESEGETSILVAPSVESEGETSLLAAPSALSAQEDETGRKTDQSVLTDETNAARDRNIYRSGRNFSLVRYSTGEHFPLSGSYLTLGKDPQNVDIFIQNDTVSRHHATITREEDTYYIIDNKSTNGTTIEGVELQPYQKAELFDGAMLSFGNEYFQVLSE